MKIVSKFASNIVFTVLGNMFHHLFLLFIWVLVHITYFYFVEHVTVEYVVVSS